MKTPRQPAASKAIAYQDHNPTAVYRINHRSHGDAGCLAPVRVLGELNLESTRDAYARKTVVCNDRPHARVYCNVEINVETNRR